MSEETTLTSAIVTVLIGLLMIAIGLQVGLGVQLNYDYTYTLETQAIQLEESYTGDANPFDDLPDRYQEALLDAFESNDNVIGGTVAEITTDNPIEISKTTSMESIEFNGEDFSVGDSQKVIDIGGQNFLLDVDESAMRDFTIKGTFLFASSMIIGMFAVLLTVDSLIEIRYILTGREGDVNKILP